MDSSYIIIFLGGLFLVSCLYSSVGHGGASGYLMLMALFQFSPDLMKPSALILNILVSFIAFMQFKGAGHFKKELFIPLIIGSVPAAFLGSLVILETEVYKFILGIILLFPALRLAGIFNMFPSLNLQPRLWGLLISGISIGFLSGLIGIGGGIILSPLLIILGWANMKESAAISALFIFLNSLSGLGGQFYQGFELTGDITTWIAIAFTGGLAGSWLGSKKIGIPALQKVLGLVLAIAVFKLLFI